MLVGQIRSLDPIATISGNLFWNRYENNLALFVAELMYLYTDSYHIQTQVTLIQKSGNESILTCDIAIM